MKKWRSTQWNIGVEFNNMDKGFIVDMKPGSSLNAIETDFDSYSIGQSISVIYDVKTLKGKPQLLANDGGAPANMSPMIAHDELDGREYVTGDPRQVCVLLQPALDKGNFRHSWKITPSLWQDVNGKQDTGTFKSDLGNAKIIQVIFGGKFRAHGIGVKNGSVRISVTLNIK